MPNRRAAATVAWMSGGPHIELALRFDVDSEPIAGSVRHGSGPAHRFHGWLELATALEQVLAADAVPRLDCGSQSRPEAPPTTQERS